MQCEVHALDMKLIPAGVSKKTGKPYNAFYVCPVDGCKWKPAPVTAGWSAVREQVAQKVAPEKASMTPEMWEEKEQRKNKNILLQVAFKAAVELTPKNNPYDPELLKKDTLYWHQWLLSQTEQAKPTAQPTSLPTIQTEDDGFESLANSIDF